MSDPMVRLGAELRQCKEGGFVPTSAAVERWIGYVAAAFKSVRWLSEAQAARRGGSLRHSKEWFRCRFSAWEALGYARLTPEGKREYHEAVVPIEPAKLALAPDPAEQARRDAAA